MIYLLSSLNKTTSKISIEKGIYINIFTAFILVSLFNTQNKASAQINITAGGSAVTQNFNSLSGVALPTDWTIQTSGTERTINNFSSSATNVANAGGNAIASNAAGGSYRFNANNVTTESAVGGLSSSSIKTVNAYCRLVNNAATPITNFTISYDVEKYRNGTNSAGFTMALYYSTNGTSWTACGSDFSTSFSSDANNNGFTPAPCCSTAISNKTYTPASSIAQNTVFYFAWSCSVTSGTTASSAPAIGIDNFSISASATSNTNPTAQSLPLIQNFGTSAFSSYPTGFQGWSGIDGSTVNTQALALASSATADATLTSQSSAFGSEPTGGLFGYATSSNGRLCIATSNNSTTGLNQLVTAINTGSGNTRVTIAYDLEVLYAGNRTTGIELEYRAGTSGTWTAVSGSAVTYTTPSLNSITSYSYTVTGLTASTNYQFRWATWRNHASGSSNTSIAIDNIIITAGQPTLTEVYIPQYIQGKATTNDERLPYVFRVTLSNLLPNTTYRYYNQAVLSSDAATLAGAGNCIFPSVGSSFTQTTTPSLSTSNNYGTFTTTGTSYTGWFVLEPTGNSRFTPGNQVYMRILLNTSLSHNETPSYILTSTSSVKVIGFSTSAGANNGSGIRGSSSATAKNIVMLYDNVSASGRPISATYVESDGFSNNTSNSYISFYQSQVDATAGAWGTIIPNNNSNGIRRIDQRALSDASLIGCAKSSNGTWTTGTVNTANPTSGTTALAISSTDAPLNTCPATVNINSSHPATGNITVGSTKNELYRVILSATDNSATLTQAAFKTAGTYTTSDIVNIKLWYNDSSSLSTADQIGVITSGFASGNTLTFSSLSSTIAVNATGYIYITVDLSSTATYARTIFIRPTSFNDINLGSASKTGVDSILTGNTQTVIVPSASVNSISVAAGNINQGSTNNSIYNFSVAVTTANATITQITLPVLYNTTADFITNGFKLWYNTANTLVGATALGSGVDPSAGNIVFTSFSQTINAGSTGYFIITADIDASATVGDSIVGDLLPLSNIIYTTTVTSSGTTSKAGKKTIVSIPYVIFDNFNRSNSNTVGTPSSGSGTWGESEIASETFRARIDGNYLRLHGCTSSTGSTGSTGSESVNYDMSAKYATTFSSSQNELTWLFNMRGTRSSPSGFGSSTYATTVILGSDESDYRSALADGYAVVIGATGGPDSVKLVSFSGGLTANSNVTNVVSSYEVGETKYYSVKVSFNPCNNQWSLQVRDDGASAFADPLSGSLGTIYTATNNTHISKNLKYFGAFWQHSSGCSEFAEFDNFYIPTSANITTTYIWNGATSDFQTAANWTPTRTCPKTNDIIQIDIDANITNVPSQTLGQLIITNNKTVTFKDVASDATNSTLTINGNPGTDFQVTSGSTFNFDVATSNNSADGLTISLATGTTAQISGNLNFQNTNSGTAGRPHSLIAADSAAIYISSTGVVKAIDLTGNPFGSSGKSNVVILDSAAVFESTDGSDLFALTQPSSKVFFNAYAIYRHKQNTAPSFSGRTYGIFEYDNGGSSTSVLFGSATNGATFTDFKVLNGTLNLTGLSNNRPVNINIKRNLSVNNGATLNYSPDSVSTLTFNGNTQQTITANGTLTLGTKLNILVNNTYNTAPQLLLQKSIRVLRNIQFNSGELYTNVDSLILGSTATITETEQWHATGNVYTQRTLTSNTAHSFGGIGLQITEGTQASNVYNVLRVNGTAISSGNAGAFSGNPSIKRYYSITPTVNSGLSALVTFSYFNSELNGIDESNLRIFTHTDPYSNTAWSDLGGLVVRDTATNSLSNAAANPISHFSTWSFASNSAPLPITLLGFEAIYINKNIQLTWTTASEVNNDGFIIEKSINGKDWTKIDYVKSKVVNTTTKTEYIYFDKDIANNASKVHYRIIPVSISGDLESEMVASVDIYKPSVLNIYPNPFDNKLQLKIYTEENQAAVDITIFDLQGKKVYTQSYIYTKGSNGIVINTEAFAQGIYLLKVSTPQGVETIKLKK